MKLSLKIVSLVFVAVGFVFLGFGFREWMKPSGKEHARDVMSSITPDKLIASCGHPLRDESVDLGTTNLRRMYYQGAVYPGHGHYLCVVTFGRVEGRGDWFPHVRPFAFGNTSTGFVAGSYTFEDDPEAQIHMLPCMDH